ncbi:PTS transporter subunit EIIB [Actinotalea sp. C106]|uniref:PTS transporter subunit EIIB n=1 Tax=Actinotalea sp. C106 TaxID=2908644 RepID=UPI002027B2EA|nr:PTS transporter subunit EIIB [Actinotalea sp. C106]
MSSLAERILDLAGGPANVRDLTHCYSRLRLTLHEDAAADEGGLRDLPEVVVVVRQGGQLQLALRQDLVATHDAMAALLT